MSNNQELFIKEDYKNKVCESGENEDDSKGKQSSRPITTWAWSFSIAIRKRRNKC